MVFPKLADNAINPIQDSPRSGAHTIHDSTISTSKNLSIKIVIFSGLSKNLNEPQ